MKMWAYHFSPRRDKVLPHPWARGFSVSSAHIPPHSERNWVLEGTGPQCPGSWVCNSTRVPGILGSKLLGQLSQELLQKCAQKVLDGLCSGAWSHPHGTAFPALGLWRVSGEGRSLSLKHLSCKKDLGLNH